MAPSGSSYMTRVGSLGPQAVASSAVATTRMSAQRAPRISKTVAFWLIRLSMASVDSGINAATGESIQTLSIQTHPSLSSLLAVFDLEDRMLFLQGVLVLCHSVDQLAALVLGARVPAGTVVGPGVALALGLSHPVVSARLLELRTACLGLLARGLARTLLALFVEEQRLD